MGVESWEDNEGIFDEKEKMISAIHPATHLGSLQSKPGNGHISQQH